MPASAVPDTSPEAQALVFEDVLVEHGRDAASRFRALDLPALTIPPRAVAGIAGPSGAGKSTLLHLVAGLLAPTRGRVLWGATDIARMSESTRTRWRRATIGFVFQDFHLFDELTLLENVVLPARFEATRLPPGIRARAVTALSRLGLDDPHRRAARLSRGERQRVAVARALLHDPHLIVADEPTASLDPAAGHEVTTLLLEAAREAGATLLVVSHDPDLLARLDTVHHLLAGRLVPETHP